MPFRIAVLSDQHIDQRSDADSWQLAKAAFEAARIADHLVIAGDLFDSASAMERDRERVRRFLRKLRLWNPDRLSIVVGNHDIFHTAHRGSQFQRGVELALAATGDADDRYLSFCDWADELVPESARYWSNDLYPFCKHLAGISLLCADTTGVDTLHSCNGYWNKDDEGAARHLLEDAGERRLLAIHHPPEPAPERTLVGQFKEGFAFGFPPAHFRRLERFADEQHLNAVVAGHIHDNGGAPWNWRLGRRTACHMVGRSGGVHGAKPCFGLLEVPRRGQLRWKTVRF